MPKKELKPRIKLDSKGRLLLPKIVRKELKLKEGAIMELEIYGENKILLTILRP